MVNELNVSKKLRLAVAILLPVIFLGCSDHRDYAQQYAKVKTEQIETQRRAQEIQDKARQALDGNDAETATSLLAGQCDPSKIKGCNDIGTIKSLVDCVDAGQYPADKIKFIDALLSPYGRNICPELDKYLRERYATSDVADFVKSRLDQLKNFSRESFFEILKSNGSKVFRAKDLVTLIDESKITVSETDNKEYVEIKAPITTKDGNAERTVYVPFKVKKADIKDQKTLNKADIENLSGDQFISFEKDKQTSKVTSHADSNSTIKNQTLLTLEKIVQDSIKNNTNIANRKQFPGLLGFDTSTTEEIDLCGNNAKTNDSTLVSLRQFHQDPSGPISGLMVESFRLVE